MNIAKVFQNPEFGCIRTVQENELCLFVANDVATALGYKLARKAIRDHVDKDDVLKRNVTDSMGRDQETLLVNESGLYSLMLSSRLPRAKEFKHWITSDVIPSIRSTGGYISTNEEMSELDILAKAVLIAQKTIEEHRKKIEILVENNNKMKPKVTFADSIMSTPDLITVNEMAKILKQNGHNIGEKRLFLWMRNNNYLIKDKFGYHVPSQMAMNLGLFRLTEYSMKTNFGSDRLVKVTKVTTKGQSYFVNKFKKEAIMTISC